MCEKDSNRKLFSLTIEEPKPDLKYFCQISKTNYENIKYIILKLNETYYEVYLPGLLTNQQSFFDLNKTSNLVMEILCTNNENQVEHKRTIDLKICKKVFKIKDILIDFGETQEGEPPEKLSIKFIAPINKTLAKLVPLDESKKNLDSYEFKLFEPNEYVDVNFCFLIL